MLTISKQSAVGLKSSSSRSNMRILSAYVVWAFLFIYFGFETYYFVLFSPKNCKRYTHDFSQLGWRYFLKFLIEMQLNNLNQFSICLIYCSKKKICNQIEHDHAMLFSK